MLSEAVRGDCPECVATVTFSTDAMVGEIVECPDCLTELEVRSVAPPTLAAAPEVEEDWGE